MTAKCGHVGRNNYIVIDFPIRANSGRQAARIARLTPRVKHHHKDAILAVNEVSYEDFMQQQRLNDSDVYLTVSNIQEQRQFSQNLDYRILREETADSFYKNDRQARVAYQRKKEDVIKRLSQMA